MEWCRMFSLRIVVCTLLLGWGMSLPWPDSAGNSTSKREQKRLELLKMLEGYSPSNRNALVPAENTLKHDLIPSLSSSSTENPMLAHTNGDTNKESEFPRLAEISTYRDYMEQIYGTREGVDLLRREFGPEGLDRARAYIAKNTARERKDMKLANDHYLRMRERRCRVPVVQLVRVRDLYPDPSKEFMPDCTLLHRCSDLTGCCRKGLHCVPARVQEVEVYFYFINHAKQKTETTKLLFDNHTACECKPINDLPRLQDERNHLLDRKEPPSRCSECPVPFTSRTYKDGRCGCDCFDRQKPCLRIKRGKEPLPEIERRCVEANHCHIPECEHGHYSVESGRCPLRHDETPRKHHRHQSHRWATLERD